MVSEGQAEKRIVTDEVDVNSNLEEEVGRLLAKKGLTLAVAESCTGGLAGHRITSVSGSSKYFIGGVIVYANQIKMKILGVSQTVLAKEGAVSESVARHMALSVRGRFDADIGIGITGIAGPTGGTKAKPVGLVFVGIADGRRCQVLKFNFSDKDRNEIKELSVQSALKMLRDFLTKEGAENV